MSDRQKKPKAIVLLSGGLDSMLAVRVLQAQDIEVEALSFKSNFYDAKKAEAAARNMGIRLHIMDIKKEMLDLVKNPPHGYGKNLNPCIDCHGMMFAFAAKGIESGQIDCDIIASGEVLGQRPFSQNKQALLDVQKLAGCEILRPLSAKLLPETEYERNGLVIRHKLYDIQGRIRERQMELAEKYGIKEYPSPAGGCLLTDPGFSERLGKMLDYWPDCTPQDVELLKYGRVFWLTFQSELDEKVLVLIGRHQEDNENLEKLVKPGDFMVKLKAENGPTGNLRFAISNIQFACPETIKVKVPVSLAEMNTGQELGSFTDLLKIVGQLTGYFATKLRGREAELEIIKI